MFGVLSINEESESPPRKRQRKSVTAIACAECKRRKVKCSGNGPPCDSCSWYKCEKKCIYSAPQPKQVVNKTSMETALTSMNDYLSIINRLFPTTPVESLVGLSQHALLSKLQQGVSSSEENSPELIIHEQKENKENQNLDQIANDSEYGWKETEETVGTSNSDDVNGLSMTSKRNSFLGASSVSTAMRVIDKISPITIQSMSPPAQAKNAQKSMQNCVVQKPQQVSYNKGLKLIDAYFSHVHPFFPLVHEKSFRTAYRCNSQTHQRNRSWMGLLYMIFALGSVADNASESNEDIIYFKSAKHFINLDSLGDGSIENLQALCLMGGCYLHYRHQPNAALAITGAALRLALSLGLHTELPKSAGMSPASSSNQTFLECEQRRRIWWSLVCMDVHANTTLGRPPVIPSSSIGLPLNFDDILGSPVVGKLTNISPLIANIGLCKIMTRIESLLATCNVPTCQNIAILDQELTQWYESLPVYMRKPGSPDDKEGLYTSIQSVKWRYLNIRLVLYRNVLLSAAISKTKLEQLDPEQQSIICKCRELCCQTIDEIAQEWLPNQMSCWKAVWFLFQACMVLLVSLYSEDRCDPLLRNQWMGKVDQCLKMFQQMSKWSRTADSTHKMVSLLYETSKKLPTTAINVPDPAPKVENEGEAGIEVAFEQERFWDQIMWDWNTNYDLDQYLDLINVG